VSCYVTVVMAKIFESSAPLQPYSWRIAIVSLPRLCHKGYLELKSTEHPPEGPVR